MAFGGTLNSDFSFGGGAVNSLFGALGDLSEAADYGLAANYATKNAQYTKLSGEIQQNQLARQTYQVQGATEASTAASGFTMGGSAADVLKSNAQQLSLNRATTAAQSLITEQGYEEQAAVYKNEENAANTAAIGGAISGVADIGAIAAGA
jgi:hypothetical protein